VKVVGKQVVLELQSGEEMEEMEEFEAEEVSRERGSRMGKVSRVELELVGFVFEEVL